MRRLVAGLVALCVVVGGTGPAWAQEASPSPIHGGGRVEVPDAGFALTVPDDWVVLVGSDVLTDAWLASAEEVAGGQLVDTFEAMVAAGVTLGMYVTAPAQAVAEVEDCTVAITPNPTGLDINEILTVNTVSIRAHPAIVGQPSSSTAELPAGLAGKMRHTLLFADPGATGREITVATYIFPAPGRIYTLGCSGFDPPDDDWLSIAETMVLLPGERSPSTPVGVGGKVDLSEVGVAWSFPDDWAWMRYSGLDWQEARSGLVGSVGDEEADWFEPFYPDLGPRDPLIAHGPDGLCKVHITPSSQALDEFVPGYLANREAGGLHYEVTGRDIDLPAGDAARLDYALVEDSPSHGWVPTDYLLSTGSAMYVIECMGPERPVDDWLSIAETFEFLPVEE